MTFFLFLYMLQSRQDLLGNKQLFLLLFACFGLSFLCFDVSIENWMTKKHTAIIVWHSNFFPRLNCLLL
jgi:hypothetical protein